MLILRFSLHRAPASASPTGYIVPPLSAVPMVSTVNSVFGEFPAAQPVPDKSRTANKRLTQMLRSFTTGSLLPFRSPVCGNLSQYTINLKIAQLP